MERWGKTVLDAGLKGGHRILFSMVIGMMLSACGGGGGGSAPSTGDPTVDDSVDNNGGDVVVSTVSKVLKTGQTTSYAGYDDGYYQMGVDRQYSRNGDIVTDHATGLMWQDDYVHDPALYSRPSYDSEEATKLCEELTLGDYTDWRVPTRSELLSLCDYSRADQAIDPIFKDLNPGEHYDPDGYTRGFLYISSTVSATAGDSSWLVYFSDGTEVIWSNSSGSVRCVRSVQ